MSEPELDLWTLSGLVRDAQSILAGVVEGLEGMSRDFLYPSDRDDETTSHTVSAVVALALDAAGRQSASFTAQALLSSRSMADGRAVWSAQDGTHFHVMATAWPTFACLRVLPAAVEELVDPVLWLVECQDPASGGWAYLRGRPSRPLYTAYVLSALIEFEALAELVDLGEPLKVVRPAIQRGVEYLLNSTLAPGHEVWLWGERSNARVPCLAATAMSTHLLAKRYRGSYPHLAYLRGPLQQVLDVLAVAVATPGWLEQNTVTLGAGPDGPLVSATWPTVRENAPAYWYRYFTPIVATTLLEVSADLRRPSPLATASETVRWLLDSAQGLGEGEPGLGIPPAPDQPMPTVWSAANGIVVLARWLGLLPDALSDVGQMIDLGAPSEAIVMPSTTFLYRELARLFPTPGDVELLLADAQLPRERFEVNGSAEEIWLGALRRLSGDNVGTAALIRAALARKESSELERYLPEIDREVRR